MTYKAIVFDLDGVICTTDEYHYLAWKETANTLGVPFDRQINNRLRGVSRMESLEIILENYEGTLSEDEKARLAEAKNVLYRTYLATMTPAYLQEEVKSTLDTLRGRGYRLAIGSSSKNAGFILERLGLAGYFDAVSDGNNVQRSKPDPEVFLKAAEFLRCAPEDCLVVEDALSGVDAAHAAGMMAAAVGDAAEKNYGDYILNCFSDLLKIL